MRKLGLLIGLGVALNTVVADSNAALVNGSTLSIESGSSFNFYDDNGNDFGFVPTLGIDGIITGSVQPYDFSITAHTIDRFLFLAVEGMHYTTAATNVLSASGGSASIDFSGWSWTFNGGAANFNLGSGSWGGNPEGVAQITCNSNCGNGDGYTLYYTATVPADEPNGFANFRYEVTLVGTVSAVPIPAAAWLFASGLLGLAGIYRTKQTTC